MIWIANMALWIRASGVIVSRIEVLSNIGMDNIGYCIA